MFNCIGFLEKDKNSVMKFVDTLSHEKENGVDFCVESTAQQKAKGKYAECRMKRMTGRHEPPIRHCEKNERPRFDDALMKIFCLVLKYNLCLPV